MYITKIPKQSNFLALDDIRFWPHSMLFLIGLALFYTQDVFVYSIQGWIQDSSKEGSRDNDYILQLFALLFLN